LGAVDAVAFQPFLMLVLQARRELCGLVGREQGRVCQDLECIAAVAGCAGGFDAREIVFFQNVKQTACSWSPRIGVPASDFMTVAIGTNICQCFDGCPNFCFAIPRESAQRHPQCKSIFTQEGLPKTQGVDADRHKLFGGVGVDGLGGERVCFSRVVFGKLELYRFNAVLGGGFDDDFF